MSSTKPIVAVTGPSKPLKFGWWAARLMLKLAGLPAQYVTAHSQNLPRAVSGVIIGGGDDIDPQHYGITGDGAADYDPLRDAMELKVVNAAIENNIPILGICRGAQLINVHCGGSLYPDIRPLRKNTPNKTSIFPLKEVELDSDSTLYQALQKKIFGINSLHNQAIKELGKGLKVVGYDRDGFIQAIESEAPDPSILGVQWHPEYMPLSKIQRRLFKQFSKRVSESKSLLDLQQALLEDKPDAESND